jgi:hypothetical protein
MMASTSFRFAEAGMIIQCVEQWWAKAEAAGKQEALVGVESSCVDPATAPIADFLSKCLFSEILL